MGREYERQELDKVEPTRSTEGAEKELWHLLTAAIEEARRLGRHGLADELYRLHAEAVKADAAKYGKGRS